MITITANLGRDEVFSLTADGHAHGQRNENDHDLVCCAASTLLCTLANSCAQLDDVNVTYHARSGYGHVLVNNCEELWDEVSSRFRMALDGLEGLAMQYPQSIRIDVDN